MRASPAKVYSHRMSVDKWTSRGPRSSVWSAGKDETEDSNDASIGEHDVKPKFVRKLVLHGNEKNKGVESASKSVETPTNSGSRSPSIPSLEDITPEG